MMGFSPTLRKKDWFKLDQEVFDLCIIGGGITGAGVARDAASRGMRVCLVEQNDFASGTSSRSSKLIHGGIRYLENYEFHLVFEALNERHILFEIAPHLVHPLSFLLPVYEDSRVGMFKMGLGMWLYDALALFHAPMMHERLSAEVTLARTPGLDGKGLQGSYVYSDAYMDDDRLVLETLRSAHSFGAVALNYVKAGDGIFGSNGKLQAIDATDLKTNQSTRIRARHFVSTVGPWTDMLGPTLVQNWKKALRPTKGIHLTMSASRLPLRDAVVMATGNDKRIIFGIPRGDMVIIGTTDTDFTGDPATVHTTASDVDYLLGVVDNYFPGAHIKKSDIIASYSGVRPLVADEAGSESSTSREHRIWSVPENITFVAGGKYTTYRRMARDIVQKVLHEAFELEDRVKFARNQTRQAINPLVTPDKLQESQAQAEHWALEFGLEKTTATTLTKRHGYEALRFMQEAATAGYTSLWSIEALMAVRHTMCLHLRDFMLRRSPLFLARSDHGEAFVPEVLATMAKELGWDASRQKEELELYREHFSQELGWQKN